MWARRAVAAPFARALAWRNGTTVLDGACGGFVFADGTTGVRLGRQTGERQLERRSVEHGD